MRVLMLQFLKGSWHYGELDAVKAFGDKFVMKQMGRGFVKVGGAEARSRRRPHGGRSLDRGGARRSCPASGTWSSSTRSTTPSATECSIPRRWSEALKKKPEMVHVILTGRNAHPTIVELADTVTEMRQVKHAYEKGVMAQRGIEY